MIEGDLPIFDSHELFQAVKTMSVNKAVGIDLVPDIILKSVVNDVSALKQLTFIINSYLAQKNYPNLGQQVD